ncbi:MAG: YraN family protein [Desulfovibrionaceae bacterium]
MAARHLTTGRAGEDAAERHLTHKGWTVLARNWRPRDRAGQGSLELDLVCREKGRKGAIVFVEVKTRAAGGLARPDQALTPAKQRNLVRAAGLWLSENNAWDKPCRFDLVAVTPVPDGEPVIEQFTNVIDMESSGGWQPW